MNRRSTIIEKGRYGSQIFYFRWVTETHTFY